jgi:MFS family permease
MFLQYASPGAFLPFYSVYLQKLGYTPLTIGIFCATQGIASIVCPLLAGQIADRWIAAERCLAVCSFLAGVSLWLLAGMTDTTASWMLFTATFAYWVLTVPILVLGNAICFAHLKDAARDFGGVRLWGTIGWMAQGWIVLAARFCVTGLSPADCTGTLFRLGSVLAFVLSGYSLTLPTTPPRPGIKGQAAAPLAALAILRNRPLFIYCVCLFGVYLTQPYLTQGAPLLLRSLGVSELWLGPTLSLSQATEALSLAILPLLLFRFGTRGTMLLGLGAWTVSLTCLALGSPQELMIASIGLSGLCITGFMVAGQVFVHRHSGAEVRASVQGLLTFVSGAGIFLGNISVGLVRHTLGEELPRAFSVAAARSGAMVLLFVFGFRERKPVATDIGEEELSPVQVHGAPRTARFVKRSQGSNEAASAGERF